MADVPIVETGVTLLTGGAEYGTQYGQYNDNPSDNSGTDFSNYVWFDPISLYCSQPSVTESDCAFFCNLCSGQLVPTMINTNELQQTAPDYPSFSPNNIMALGVCQIFEQWMFEFAWQGQTSGQGGLPGAPGSGPGNGGGVWG